MFDDSPDVLSELCLKAEANGGLNYVFTLLRVTGITRSQDALAWLACVLNNPGQVYPPEDAEVRLHLLDGIEESLGMLSNLISCSAGGPFKHRFFSPLYCGSFPNIIKPSVEQMVAKVQKHALQKDRQAIADLLGRASLTSLFEKAPPAQEEQRARAKCFLQGLIDLSKAERLRFKGRQRFCKLARFDVLELLTNDADGIYGFRLHLSNGSAAHFIRLPDSTDSVNISFDRESEFVLFVGDLDALTEEWRVGDKRLYEIGLPGRYNQYGEWKPLVYPQRKSKIIDSLQHRAMSLSQDDAVRGILFYIMCTAHQAIEFVVKADIELPWQDTTLGEVLHLWKCPGSELHENFFIYDGTCSLTSCDPEEIEMAITVIGLTLNTIAFAYNASLQWRLKYNIIHSTQNTVARLEEADLDILKSILEKYPRNKDGLILNAAIDWYNRGVGARDVFAGFLCYYRVIELVVSSIYSGKATFDLGFQPSEKAEARRRSVECIDRKFEELYGQDKFRFVTSAYAECIQGTRARTEQVLRLVFGEGSQCVKDLFEGPQGSDECSLYQIRNGIAHGSLSLLEKDDVELVRKRLWDLRRIAKEILMRLSCSLKPSEEPPKWSGHGTLALSAHDPRTYLVVTREDIFPKDADWRIKPEWCA